MPTSKLRRQNSLLGYDNHDVDFVVLYDYGVSDTKAKSEVTQQFRRLVQVLNYAGLDTQVRPAKDNKLLVFVKAKEKPLKDGVYRSRVRDWLNGIRHAQPNEQEEHHGIADSQSERLRVVYHMIILPLSDHGAGVVPESPEWSHVEAIFPLHDKEVNNQWIRKFSSKTFLSTRDLDEIRNVYGERVGFYFAFLQSYFGFLMIPAIIGFTCWVFFNEFSMIFAVTNTFSSMLYVEFWRRRQEDLAIRWQSKGVNAIRTQRREFVSEKEVTDEMTGEKIQIFPLWKRTCRQLLQVPLAIASILSLGTLIATCFAIEIFLVEVYDGPFKAYLTFIPTILLSALVPGISEILTSFARRLNEFENYDTMDAFEHAMVRKHFVIDFITNYLPILLTAFVYVPLGSVLVPTLDRFRASTMNHFVAFSKNGGMSPLKEFKIDRTRLRGQVIYFAVTAQIVGQLLEIGMPYVKRKLLRKYKDYSEQKRQSESETPSGSTANSPQNGSTPSSPSLKFDDLREEADFLNRVRDEVDLEVYDISDDYQEMCVQFGNMTLFSCVWPLVPLAFLCNNWVELRSDFVKISTECRRPVPRRAENIGPWLDNMEFLAWLGSVTTAAMLYMFRNHGDGAGGLSSEVTGWMLLLSIIFAEHAYLLLRWVVRSVLANVESSTKRIQKAQQYLLRKEYMDTVNAQHSRSRPMSPDSASSTFPSNPSEEARTSAHDIRPKPAEADEKQALLKKNSEIINRGALEEEARYQSQQEPNPANVFWSHQQSWRETAHVGVGIIGAYDADKGMGPAAASVSNPSPTTPRPDPAKATQSAAQEGKKSQ